MQYRLWSFLSNVKFKALYTYKCSKHSDQYGRLYSFVLALVSATSIAAWTIWERIPKAWTIIVAASQVLHIAKPYFPFLKNSKTFLEMSYDFELLYIQLEKLWYSIENKTISIDEAENLFYKYREQVITIEKSHENIVCPFIKNWINETSKTTHNTLKINFDKGE